VQRAAVMLCIVRRIHAGICVRVDMRRGGMYLYVRLDPPKVLDYLNAATKSAVESTMGTAGVAGEESASPEAGW